MGQKTNPNILRLGINKIWKTEFIEKKGHELPAYTSKDLEIKGYIERFLESQNLLLHDYRQHYSDSTLNLYISYLVSAEFATVKRRRNDKLILVTKSRERKTVSMHSQYKTSRRLPSLKIDTLRDYNVLDSYHIKEYLEYSKEVKDIHDLRSPVDKKEVTQRLKIEGILNNLFKVLSLFTNNNLNIIAHFCCINKTSSYLKSTQKKSFILLQKFKNTLLLKEGIELLFHIIHNRASADLLAKFVSLQIKKTKRHKFVLSFLKQTLKILYTSKFSVVNGVKVVVKGRLNGVPRAKQKAIIVGDVPAQSIAKIVDFSQVTVNNANGSYGIKVWIAEKT